MNFVEFFFIFSVFAVTTAAACAFTRRTATLDSKSILNALRGLVDWAGTFAVFFAANIVSGAAVIFVIRVLTTHFVSTYALSNILFPIFSAIQAFIFHALWRRR